MALVAVGACGVIVGAVGLATDRRLSAAPASSTTGRSSPAPTSSASPPSATGRPSTAPGSLSSPTPTVPPPAPTSATVATETPAEFLDALAAALRSGDDGFLLDRLHPAVIQRFGVDLCRRHVATLHDP